MKIIDVVFDGPPSHESGRFVEVEDDSGHSTNVGRWIDRKDGFWALRLKVISDSLPGCLLGLHDAVRALAAGVPLPLKATALHIAERLAALAAEHGAEVP